VNTLKAIWYRYRQFRQAVKTRLTLSDIEFVRAYLTQVEQVLFYRMALQDQRHALLLAQTFLGRHHTHDYTWVDTSIFIRAALLHDVGKSFLPISVWSRSMYVILQNWKGGALLAKKATAQATKPFWQKMAVLANHGELGAQMLQSIGTLSEIIEVARSHHNTPQSRETKLLPIIREIDGKI
jgi:putative nucleotidyltransferase with HDIG domain